MKLITNIIHLMLLLLVLSMSVSPAHAAILNPEILISEQGNGFYVCNDVDRLASCTKYSGTNVLISEDTTPSFDRNEASLIVFNAPLSFSTRAASAYIQVEYDGINTPECTYAFVAPNNVNIPENNLGVRLVTQSCTLAKDGRSAITAYSTGDQPMFVIELSRLCRVDDSGDGRNCEFDWNDEITSFQLSSAGVAPTDEDLCSNLEDKQTTMPLGYDDADQDYVCTPQRIYIGLSERVYNFYNWALGVGGMVALALIIYAGVLYSASGGNPGRMTEAKLWIQHALFGLALLFGSYIVLSFINPNLTTLEDVFVESAPQVSGGRLEFERNISSEDAQCRADSLENVAVYSDCEGFYVTSESGRTFARGSHLLANAGNFGDPDCDRKNMSRTDYVDELRTAMAQELNAVKNQIPEEYRCDYNIERLKYIFVDGWEGKTAVVLGESGYNPNATLLRGDYRADGQEVPQCTGAWGLFQMGKEGLAEGDIPWREQVANAAAQVVAGDRGHCYWAQWPGRISGTCPCSTCLPRYVTCPSDNSTPPLGPLRPGME